MNDREHRQQCPDELDALLRQWHETNRRAAGAGRDRLLAALRAAGPEQPARIAFAPRARAFVRNMIMNRYTPAAAALIALIVLLPVLLPGAGRRAAGDQIMVPDGGRLDAFDERGHLIGPCPLAHTDARVEIAGHFSRVTLTQRYHNPYDKKIEAVYTFPLSHRAAVDRMTMTVGERVIEGEVKERAEARRLYDAARSAGYVASLLEQERPNIFTQSVANIEPGAEVLVEISYVEVLEMREGRFAFDFPMVVGPRYIPGTPTATHAFVPEELNERRGVVLLGPAQLTLGQPGNVDKLGTLQPGKLAALLHAAQPIDYPGAVWWGEGENAKLPDVWYPFEAAYCDGAKEIGWLFVDGTGQINDRWFWTDPRVIEGMDSGFAADTNQVPDASRITPMPVRPPGRAGHEISLTVTIDSGGPGLVDLRSELHEIVVREEVRRDDGLPTRLSLTLAKAREIPNRDFVVSWGHREAGIHEATLAHAGEHGGFFTLILAPPARVDEAEVPPRELIFVLDTSGSMQGFPIEKARDVMERAIDAMRPADTFNLITFSGNTRVLWERPRPNTPDNRAEAKALVEMQGGAGGTEMMAAIDAALRPSIASDRPDGPAAALRIVMFLTDGYVGNDQEIIRAVAANAASTRVFAFGIGNSVNRFLLDGMARAGRGEVEYVLLESDAEETVQRFVRRIERPVLTDVHLEFSPQLAVSDVIPPVDVVPDLFDVAPLVIHGRYAGAQAGTLTISGRSGAGPWTRTIALDLPQAQPEHDVIAALWARARIDQLMQSGDQAGIVALGEQFQIMSQYTSFVAIEKSRLTIDGKPMLVAVPIELPQGVSWKGVFGWEDETMEEIIVPLKHADAQKLADELNILLNEAGANIALARPDTGLSGQGRPGDMRTLSETWPSISASLGPPTHYRFRAEDSWVPPSDGAGQPIASTRPGRPSSRDGAHPPASPEERLRRLIDQRLWQFVFEADQARRPEEPLLLSLLVSDTSDETLAALAGAGLVILDRVDATNHIVGRLAAEKLQALGVLPCVRRIELLERVPAL